MSDFEEDAIAREMSPEVEDAPEPEPDMEPEPDDEPDTEPEPEPDTEPSSFDAMEAMGRSFTKLTAHVEKRSREILGDSFEDFEPCECCNYWGTPGWRMKGPLPEAVENVLRLALDGHASDEWKADEYSRACEKCNGIGQVLTGSKADGQQTIQCLACKGMGWVPVGSERATGAFAMPNGGTPAPAPIVSGLTPVAPEDPAVTAAKQALSDAGYFIVPPVPQTA